MTIHQPKPQPPRPPERGAFTKSGIGLVTPAVEARIGLMMAEDARRAGHRPTYFRPEPPKPEGRKGSPAKEAQRREAMAWRAQGLSFEAIGRAMGLPRTTAQGLIRGADPLDRPTADQAEQQAARRATALRLHADGLSYAEIGARMGISRQAVKGVVRRALA